MEQTAFNMEQNTLKLLKENDQDYEWYPTTDEIINAIKKDLIKTSQKDMFRYSHGREGIDFNTGRRDEGQPDTTSLDSFLDIGAGDGRVLDKLTEAGRHNEIRIKERYGIEKATVQGDNLVKSGVALLGRDFFETVLIDRKFTVVFSNPPYSEYKEWTIKLLQEVNAKFIYLVLPVRWKTDQKLIHLFKDKGEYEIIGSYDFSEAERAARARVDVIKVTVNKDYDTFRSWVEDNIGKFETNDHVDLGEESEYARDSRRREETEKWMIDHKDDTVAQMVENYQEDLQNLLKTFQALGSIDWSIISQLGVNKSDVIGKVRGDIAALKDKYWRLTFDHLKEITDRLTHKMRGKILDEITWFAKLDFNENNIRTIVIWIIENFNKYTVQQMLDVYDAITDCNGVRAYKSNDKWLDDNWRYTKPMPTKYSLDYRIVVSIGYQLYYSSYRKEEAQCGNPIEDLSIVARSLGFDNWGALAGGTKIVTGEKYECNKKHFMSGHAGRKMDDDVLFEYKIYQNNNVHFKIDQEFLKVLNIEVGKERGWLKDPQHVQDEFDLSAEEALKFFTGDRLKTIGSGDLLMLTA